MSMNELYERLGGIDSKLDQLLSQKGDHEGRIRVLEAWRWRLAGALALIGVGTPFAVHALR